MDETNPPISIESCCKALEGFYGPTIEAGGIFLFVLFTYFFTRIILKNLSVQLLQKNRIWPLTFVLALSKPLNYFMWFYAAVSTIDIFSSYVFASHFLDMHLLFTVGGVLSFGWFLLRWNNSIAHHIIELSQHNQIDISLAKADLFKKIGTVVIFFMTLFLLMDVTGRNMQTLITFGGIGGLALAFASQQVIANFFGGLMVYTTQPFTIGEKVSLPEKKIEGYIEEIGWYMTRIRNMEKRPIYVPNSIFSQTIVITPSRMSHERFHLKMNICNDAIGVIKEVIDDIKLMLLKDPHIDQGQHIDVHFLGFSHDSLEIEISAFTSISSGASFPSVRQEVLLNIAEILQKHGAKIASSTNFVGLPTPLIIPPTENQKSTG